jgi:hypothetical protein
VHVLGLVTAFVGHAICLFGRIHDVRGHWSGGNASFCNSITVPGVLLARRAMSTPLQLHTILNLFFSPLTSWSKEIHFAQEHIHSGCQNLSIGHRKHVVSTMERVVFETDDGPFPAKIPTSFSIPANSQYLFPETAFLIFALPYVVFKLPLLTLHFAIPITSFVSWHRYTLRSSYYSSSHRHKKNSGQKFSSSALTLTLV